MFPIKTVLHATDFSEQAANAFQVACALARDYKARLVVVHVHPSLLTYPGELVPLMPEPPEVRQSLLSKLDSLKPMDASIETRRYMVEGDPAAEIVRAARERQADIIVIGTHGRTGMGRLLMGSVAEQVVRKAPCPVLTLKEPAAKTDAV